MGALEAPSDSDKIRSGCQLLGGIEWGILVIFHASKIINSSMMTLLCLMEGMIASQTEQSGNNGIYSSTMTWNWPMAHASFTLSPAVRACFCLGGKGIRFRTYNNRSMSTGVSVCSSEFFLQKSKAPDDWGVGLPKDHCD